MTTLRLFLTEAALPASPATEVEWRTLNGPQSGHGRSALSALPAASRVELFLPPARVLRTTVSLPKGAGKQASKLLPFALDQVLLAEPTEQHLAHQLVGEQCRVAAVQRELLAELMNTLTQVGRRPRAAWASDALVAADGSVLLWCGNGWARRTGETSQWFDAVSPADPPPLLVALLGDVPQLELAAPKTAQAEIAMDRWTAALGRPVQLADGDAYSNAVASDAVELLQGEFAAGTQFDVDWNRLRPTAWLAGSAVLLALLVTTGQWLSWRSEEQRLRQGIDTAYTKAFPKEPLVDARLQLQAKLASNATPALAPQAGSLAPLLKVAPQLQASGVPLVTLDYLEGRVEAEYQAAPDQLGNLVQALSANGKVEVRPSGTDRTRLILTPQS